MKIRFVVTDASGAVLVTGEEPTHSAALSSWTNHSSVVRLPRASSVRDRVGQRLVMWIEDDAGDRRARPRR